MKGDPRHDNHIRMDAKVLLTSVFKRISVLNCFQKISPRKNIKEARDKGGGILIDDPSPIPFDTHKWVRLDRFFIILD